MRLEEGSSTKLVSLEASLSTGIMNRKKKTERMANPLAVRVYAVRVSGHTRQRMEQVLPRLRGPRRILPAHRAE
jgi:hypothetical protein